MKIAVVGDMDSSQQSVIDKMIADGHEIVHIGKDEQFVVYGMDFCIVDEYSELVSSMFDSIPFNPITVGVMQRPQWKVKTRSPKPYYRQKEKY